MIDRYRKMMFRTARRITQNDCDADDVIQRLCVRFVIGGIPAGLRENPPAYLIGAIVKEAKNVQACTSTIPTGSTCRSLFKGEDQTRLPRRSTHGSWVLNVLADRRGGAMNATRREFTSHWRWVRASA